MKTINIKRIYDNKKADGSYRILVDKLWPRGIKKSDLDFDEWDKDIAPSAALRKWFGHKPERFEQFTELYNEELSHKQERLTKIKELAKTTVVSLLYGAKDPKINHAIVLLNNLEK